MYNVLCIIVVHMYLYIKTAKVHNNTMYIRQVLLELINNYTEIYRYVPIIHKIVLL